MTMRVYNTLTNQKEDFQPVYPGKVGMYVCGPTVYDSCHIGHARSVVVFDVVARYLRHKGLDVTYIRNFTDVDDKIINKAADTGLSCEAVAEKYIQEFYEDMDALNVQRATQEPRATQYVDAIVSIVEQLVEKNFAYVVDGDVYYSVEAFSEYGKLSGRKLDQMEAGARVAIDQRKVNPFDFALWKAAKPGEPSWPSPWGAGRPGWHIECSAMSTSLLGQTLDIHGGGKDLIFPHHENEIAQSEAASGQPFARYWMHNGFVNIDHEKMSKSLGNFTMIKDVLKQYHPEVVRLFLLSSHYRSPIDFTDKALAESGSALEKIYNLLARAAANGLVATAGDASRFKQDFNLAMDDDFNSARGIGVLFEALRHINRLLDQWELNPNDADADEIGAGLHDLEYFGSILGVPAQSPEAFFADQKQRRLADSTIDAADIDKLVAQRSQARKDKDWALADTLRDTLTSMGVSVEDRADGSVWKFSDL